jgi:hypothetical protein
VNSSSDSKVSRERLNQIALRKLKSFGVATQLEPREQTLLGEWTFKSGKVVAPGTQVRVASARFRVEGHDRVLFLNPPLAALGPLVFYDCEGPDLFEVRIARALSVRLGFLQSLAGQLARLQIQVKLDGNTLSLRGEVESTEQVFELEATPTGVRVIGVRPRLATRPAEAADFPLRLEDHASRTDLELFLATAAQKGELALRSKQAAKTEAGAELTAVPATAGALSVALLQRLGPEAMLTVQNGSLEVTQDFRLGASAVRFVATHVSGTTFRGRLVAGGAERWADRFELARFPGIEQLVRICLGIPAPVALEPRTSAEATASAHAGAGNVFHQLKPSAGEIWVMNVLVERESDGEIRYSCADVDGRPYGATRLLKSDDFRATFSPHGPSWRLRIAIARVDGETVVYRQVNPKGERGPEKMLAWATLSTIFVPEAQAY